MNDDHLIGENEGILEYLVTIYLASSALDAAREVSYLNGRMIIIGEIEILSRFVQVHRHVFDVD